MYYIHTVCMYTLHANNINYLNAVSLLHVSGSAVGLGERDILRMKLTVDFLRYKRHFGSERVFFRFREVQMLCILCCVFYNS